MEMGRHTEKAIIRHQERASFWYEYGQQLIDLGDVDGGIWSQEESTYLYATARKLMNIEPEGTENV